MNKKLQDKIVALVQSGALTLREALALNIGACIASDSLEKVEKFFGVYGRDLIDEITQEGQ